MKNQQFPPEVEADLQEYREKGPATAKMIGCLILLITFAMIVALIR